METVVSSHISYLLLLNDHFQVPTQYDHYSNSNHGNSKSSYISYLLLNDHFQVPTQLATVTMEIVFSHNSYLLIFDHNF